MVASNQILKWIETCLLLICLLRMLELSVILWKKIGFKNLMGQKHGKVWIDFWFSSIAMPSSQGSHWVSTEQIPAR
jgi:hypothetical protein